MSVDIELRVESSLSKKLLAGGAHHAIKMLGNKATIFGDDDAEDVVVEFYVKCSTRLHLFELFLEVAFLNLRGQSHSFSFNSLSQEMGLNG